MSFYPKKVEVNLLTLPRNIEFVGSIICNNKVQIIWMRRRRVKPIITIVVIQVITLKSGPFVWSPISFLSLMSRSMKMRINGSTMPLIT